MVERRMSDPASRDDLRDLADAVRDLASAQAAVAAVAAPATRPGSEGPERLAEGASCTSTRGRPSSHDNSW